MSQEKRRAVDKKPTVVSGFACCIWNMNPNVPNSWKMKYSITCPPYV
jgi:hypothetical protein